MAWVEIAYDSAGAGISLLISEVSSRIGPVTLHDVIFEAEGHNGPLLSGVLRIAGELDTGDTQKALDDLAADFAGNGLFLWAEARER